MEYKSLTDKERLLIVLFFIHWLLGEREDLFDKLLELLGDDNARKQTITNVSSLRKKVESGSM